MGDDAFEANLFFINKETGETGKIGTVSEIKEVIPENEENKTECAFEGTISIPFEFKSKIFKTIKKKRAIKILMSWGYQRNEAYKVEKLYMLMYKTRTLLNLRLFCKWLGGNLCDIK